MTDKQMYILLEHFINDSPLAEEIKVAITHYHKSFRINALAKSLQKL